MALQQEAIKWIAGTNFMVDGFRFQNPRCHHYFLTHYHSDHTIGLYKSFSSGIVYCSRVTAALLTKCTGLRPECIRVLPMDQSVMVEDVEVTALDANHCPGSVMLLFKVPGQQGRPGQVILHTGDFRYHDRMADYPSLRNTVIDTIYLDTTYAYPRHTFPSQEDAIATIVRLCRKHLNEEPRTLFVFGAYQIGKERAVIGAAKALGLKVHIEPRKRRILSLLELDDMDVFTPNAAEANIHLGFMSEVRPPAMLRRLKEGGGQWAHVVGFRPTGWSFRKDGVHTTTQGLATVYGVPYSEHSSFDDLRACIAALRPRKITPTVNADTKLKAANLVARFADLMDLSANRYRIDAFFRPRPLKRPPPDRGTADVSKHVGSAITGSEQSGSSTLGQADTREHDADGLKGEIDGRDEVGGFLRAIDGGAESCGADVSGLEADSGFGGFETEGMDGLDCEAPAEEAGFTGADDGVSERGEDTDGEECAEEANTDAGSGHFGQVRVSGKEERADGEDAKTDVDCERFDVGGSERGEDTDGEGCTEDADTDAGCGRFDGGEMSDEQLGAGGNGSYKKAVEEDSVGFFRNPVDSERKEAFRGDGSRQPLEGGCVIQCGPADGMQKTGSIGGDCGWNGVGEGRLGDADMGSGGAVLGEEQPSCREEVGREKGDRGGSIADCCAADENERLEMATRGAVSNHAPSGDGDGCHLEGADGRHVDGERETEGNVASELAPVRRGASDVASGFIWDARAGLRAEREGTRRGEEDPAVDVLCARTAGQWECDPQPMHALESRMSAALVAGAERDTFERVTVRSTLVDESSNEGEFLLPESRGRQGFLDGENASPRLEGGPEGSRGREPMGGSPLAQSCVVHSCEVSVDILTIDSREQAYILRCIEQAKVKEKLEAKVKRKGAALKGRQALVRKDGVADGKKPKLASTSVSVQPSPSLEKTNRQRLIRSFFSSKP